MPEGTEFEQILKPAKVGRVCFASGEKSDRFEAVVYSIHPEAAVRLTNTFVCLVVKYLERRRSTYVITIEGRLVVLFQITCKHLWCLSR